MVRSRSEYYTTMSVYGKWMINDEVDMNTKPDQVPAVYYIP